MELLFDTDKIVIVGVYYGLSSIYEPLAKLHIINIQKEAKKWKILLSIRKDSDLLVPAK